MDNDFLGVTLYLIVVGVLIARIANLQSKNKELHHKCFSYMQRIDKLMLDIQDCYLERQEEKQFFLRQRDFHIAVIERMKNGDNYATANKLVSEYFRKEGLIK